MNQQNAIEVLKAHQEWRMGADIPPTDPKQLTAAIDVVLEAMEESGNLSAIKNSNLTLARGGFMRVMDYKKEDFIQAGKECAMAVSTFALYLSVLLVLTCLFIYVSWVFFPLFIISFFFYCAVEDAKSNRESRELDEKFKKKI